jgi:hypothetical protein
MPIPDGMSDDTFEYVLKFTALHEGVTPFMYNNWSEKNTKRDVTVGVGYAVTSETHAASPEIRLTFRVKGTSKTASDPEMRAEYRRVYNTERKNGNLYTAFQAPSPLEMDIAGMYSLLRKKMLEFWDSRGRNIPNFGSLPAQAQVALMSYNYGLRLSAAPHMCDAVRDGNYQTAAKESYIKDWAGHKNAAHRRLILNAGAIIRTGADPAKLPPLGGVNTPVLLEPGVVDLGAEATLNKVPTGLTGRWMVTIGDWRGVFFFDAGHGVTWANSDYAPKHTGRWSVNGGRLEWRFKDPGDFRVFTAQLPLNPGQVSGTILPAGQGWFSMSKTVTGVA